MLISIEEKRVLQGISKDRWYREPDLCKIIDPLIIARMYGRGLLSTRICRSDGTYRDGAIPHHNLDERMEFRISRRGLKALQYAQALPLDECVRRERTKRERDVQWKRSHQPVAVSNPYIDFVTNRLASS